MTMNLWSRSVNGDIYAQALAGVYQPGLRVYDPDYALFEDPDFYDKLTRDAIVHHAIEMRRHLIAGRDWMIQPAGSTRQDKIAAKICEFLLRQMHMLPSAIFDLSQAVVAGSAWAEIQGKKRYVSIAGLKPMAWWTPIRLKDVDKRRVRVKVDPELTSDGKLNVYYEFFNVQTRAWDKLEHPENFVKHVYEDTESRLGYGRGLAESIWYYHYAKEVVLTEGLNACERWAQGLVEAKIDGAKEASTGKANNTIVQNWMDTIKKLRSRHVLVTDKSDELKIHEMPGQGWQIITSLLDYLDKSITMLILGSNLPTGASDGGSFALGRVQESSREALISYDRSLLSEAVTRDLIGLLWRNNQYLFYQLGLTEMNKPRFAIVKDQRDDSQTAATIVQAMLAAGIPLRKDEVYEKTGFTTPQEGDDVIKPVPQAQAPVGLGSVSQSVSQA
jgi:hypothetical protein